MPGRFARKAFSVPSPLRAAQCLGLAAVALVSASNSLQTAIANGDTRSLTLIHSHRDDQITVTFKRDGKYDEEGLKTLNHFLRDWRNDKETNMDPHLFDVVWDVYRDVGGKEPIHIVSAYRSPETNAMLRRRSTGVARFSQHMLGKAMDFWIPNVPLEELRYAGLRLQRGGVGFYPTSGSPFVHLDTGSVRHWPRMAPDMLARVLSTSKTQVASAERRRMPLPATDEDEAETTTARAVVASRMPVRKPETKPTVVATAPNAQQAFALASASSTPFTLGSAPRRAPEPARVASADPNTGVKTWLDDIDQRSASNDRVSPETALAYAANAAVPEQRSPSLVNPMPMRAAAAVQTAPQAAATTQISRTPGKPVIQAKPGQRYNDPWMRSLTLADSVHYSKVTAYGPFDARGVQVLMQKPAVALALTFREDPYDGMMSVRFTGPAVAFLPLMSFERQRQASLLR